MPRWQYYGMILAFCLGTTSRPALGQWEAWSRAPMPVSNASHLRSPRPQPITQPGPRATLSPRVTPQPWTHQPPLQLAQFTQPFDPNTPPDGFSSPDSYAAPGDGYAGGGTSAGSYPPSTPYGASPGVGPSTGFSPASPGYSNGVTPGFQPWSPDRPASAPYPAAGATLGTPLGTPPGYPSAPGLPPSPYSYPSNGVNDPISLGRFGLPPQGFDPGFSPEVQVADLTVNVTPSSQSLHYFAGLGFNSDQGVFGRLSYDDRDFDWSAFPWRNPPVPFRGGGQRLRLEAMPGAEMQRYLISFEQPFFAWFGGRPVSFHLSGHYFERDYFDWNERRAGGRFGFGYGINDALSLNTKFQLENVDISHPRILVPELLGALGDHERYSGAVTLVYDTRDVPFAPSTGSYLELGFEQVFGSFDYPRGTVDYRHYRLLGQRPDRSGRHIVGLTFDGAITGSDTPIYDNYFAGGYSTLRGFRFRHASPKNASVIVGGELSLTGSAEYYFPVTADDMIRGVLFSDIGTISEETSIRSDDLRVSVGGGLRIYIPALGPAPVSIDAAVPVVRADTDRIQNIHFYVNLGF